MGAMKEPSATLYEADYYAWVHDQADALRRGDVGRLDLENLIDEVESLGRSEEHQLESRLAQLLMHLLKWEFQSSLRSRSWTSTMKEQRRRLDLLFKRMPSLRPRISAVLEDAYSGARLMAERETGLVIDTFPPTCHYSIEQLLDPQWFPAVDWLPPE